MLNWQPGQLELQMRVGIIPAFKRTWPNTNFQEKKGTPEQKNRKKVIRSLSVALKMGPKLRSFSDHFC